MKQARLRAYWIPGALAVLQLTACEVEQPAAPLDAEPDILASSVATSASWTRQFGTAGHDRVWGVAVHGSDVYTGGTVEAGGEVDASLRRFDLHGNEVWVQDFGTPGFDEVRGVAAEASAVYAVGWVTGVLPDQTESGGGDAYIRKYDANGTELWTRQFGTPARDNAIAVQVHAGIVHVAGFTSGTLPGQTSAGGVDGFVRAYDTEGNELWTRQFGTGAGDFAIGLAVEGGQVYVSGWTGGTLAGDGSSGGDDAFVRAYDVDGNELWTRQFGTSEADLSLNVSAHGDAVHVVGFTFGAFDGETNAGSGDAFVRAYDRSGSELWTDQFGSADFDVAEGVATHGGHVYVAGSGGALAGTPTAGGNDAFLRTYRRDGEPIATRVFGSEAGDGASSVAVQGGVFVAGTTSGSLPGQTSHGGNDGFLVKFRMP
ncbi:MAG TPA: hypothetical protein VMN78_12845 [Longimicrobiales bacterium]|nr:hypothetical protein [Longimicrobiales bacterium]